MKALKNSWIAVGLIVVLCACGETPLYNKSYSFKNNAWEQNVKPVFQATIPDTTHFYTIQITIRTTTDYAFNNLWFFIHSKTPQGQTGREPVEMKIANPDGSWIGEASGTIVENTVYFKHRKFPQKGNYTFTFEQGITEQSARNVMDISFAVIRDPNQK
ncbi:gliding motility lipoprotein GldH [Fluviicola sp.]|jgi:gliding motility-associated lipoprotein GldH|uniref:gliding motility lipoprotein GldH n=1 Tax=Fluviicola sp. TaxID=1917219 RepID=UPI002825D356|nr:gliding motility lipoprotein GldH [Fluviicola sp.]MDR0801596.1 gliding motility lipoprotein GldH [Fluviicola sp.]